MAVPRLLLERTGHDAMKGQTTQQPAQPGGLSDLSSDSSDSELAAPPPLRAKAPPWCVCAAISSALYGELLFASTVKL